MLIDGDNADYKLLDKILEEASKYGTVTIRRIYGDWTDPSMSSWREVANRHAFQTPHQLHYTKGKNATDTLMIIEAMDLLHSGHVDGFCIVSSDSDFTGLAKRIREQGMFVMGMGKTTTPESFRAACEVFTFVELISEQYEVVAATKRHGKNSPRMVKGVRDWKDTVIRAIEMTRQEEWARLADVGNNIVKIDPSFDARHYGSKTLLSLIRTAQDTFEVREEELDGHLPIHYVRALQ